jgi:transcriptional regulator with XRE-family HTH domain
MSDRSTEQRKALGLFLRQHRAKILPAMVGLPPGSRRRTPGLRREEVAELAGISTTWYSWVEQGRDVALSATALSRLANGLELSRAERSYLFELAGKRDPKGFAVEEMAGLPPGLAAVVQSLPTPAYLLDRFWRARAWSATAERLFIGWLDRPGSHSLLEYVFLEPAARSLIRDWQDRARRILAEFRVDFSRYIDDPDLVGLVADLARRSALFARAWEEHAVLGREGGERTFDHPRDGFQRFEQVAFNLASRPEFKLMVLTPLPSPSADRIRGQGVSETAAKANNAKPPARQAPSGPRSKTRRPRAGGARA